MDKQIQDSRNKDMREKKQADGAEEQAGDHKAKRRLVKNIPLLIAEICMLVAAVVILYVVVTATDEVERRPIDKGRIIINKEVKQTQKKKKEEQKVSKGYHNIALFGVDARDGQLGRGTRSDTIIIASINLDTQEIKLVSVFRDTYLNLSNDTYNKCNAAYAQGGPEQAISMLNANLDMNIKDFVTIGFAGLIDTINALGGIPLDITNEEIHYLNDYQYCIAEDLKRQYTPVSNAGLQVVDGMQATGYCRIRYTKGDDFKRAERQRNVLKAIMDKSKEASVTQLVEIANDVFDEVYTSFGIGEITELLGEASGYRVVADDGFPTEDRRWTGNIGSPGDCIVPNNLADNVSWLHEFLFDESGYVPSNEVQNYSDHITGATSKYKPKGVQ